MKKLILTLQAIWIFLAPSISGVRPLIEKIKNIWKSQEKEL